MARNRFNISQWSLICLLWAGGMDLMAGEKIQFDIPTERDEQPIDVRERPKRSGNAFENADRQGPATGNFQQSIPTPPREIISKEELEKKRNWLSRDKDKEEPTAEDVFNVTGFSSKTKEQPQTFLGNPLEIEQQAVTPDAQKKQPDSAYERMNHPSIFTPQLQQTQQQQRGIWETSAAERQFSNMPAANNFGDFWGDKVKGLSMNENPTRRIQVSEILERRPTGQTVNSFLDSTLQPVNPVEGVGASAFDRPTQNGFVDQWKGTTATQANLQRNTMEDLRPKVVTPFTPRTEVAPAASTWMKPQPAVLTVPKRPGSLF